MTATTNDTRMLRHGGVDISHLVERARALTEAGGRRVLGITGAPGAGKSTVCAAIREALGSNAVLVTMDGFHLANSELRRLGRRDRKGAPDTFDVDGYVALLARLRTQTEGVVYAPLFNRSLEESIGSAIPVRAEVPLVITEGNYLLHRGAGWGDVAAQLDEVWYLDVDATERERRLLARRRSHGHPADEAAAWVRDVDGRNAAVVEASKDFADLVLRLSTANADPSNPTHPLSDHEGTPS